MLQSPEPKYSPATPANTYTPVQSGTSTMEQTHIARSVVIKGQVTGAEPLFVDGRIEGTINFPENRVTIGRNGNVAANITAKEVVIMGKVQGNVDCSDRLDIRSEGQLSGDVVTHRISVEEGASSKVESKSATPKRKIRRRRISTASPRPANRKRRWPPLKTHKFRHRIR